MSKKTGTQPALHKVIMVGSGGVGKSALTLQFMYDEVSIYFALYIPSYISVCKLCVIYSSSKTTNQLKPILIEKKLF